ncbi:MAG: hypothetical protein ABIQ04_00525 [Candidatus Saccharimonadales bacterium]
MTVSKDAPFTESIKLIVNNLEVEPVAAVEMVNKTYENFKDRNQKLLERQSDRSNNAQVQLISHFALLATLTLTVTGFVITQTENRLTPNQQWLILFILFIEILSIVSGAIDYLQTIHFHDKWSKVYHNVDKEVNAKFKDGTLQRTAQLGEIEAKYVDSEKASTKMWVTYTMVGSCVFGLFSLVLLFYAYFFDVPFI